MSSKRNLPIALSALTLITLACVCSRGIQSFVEEQPEQNMDDFVATDPPLDAALEEASSKTPVATAEETSSLPLPPDAEIVQLGSESDDISGDLGGVQYGTDLSIDELVDFYLQSLPPLGLLEQSDQSNVTASDAFLTFIDEEGRRSVFITMGSPIPAAFELQKSTLVLVLDIQLAPLAAVVATPVSEASWELTQVSYFGTNTQTTAIGLITNTGDVPIEVATLVSFFDPDGGKPFQHDRYLVSMWCAIYPGQTAPVAVDYVHSFDPNPEIAEVKIDLTVDWPRPDELRYIEDFYINDFEVVHIGHNVLSEDVLDVSGELRNVSGQDLTTISYTIMLFDPSGTLLAAQSPFPIMDIISDQESFPYQITIEGVPANQVASADVFACGHPVP